MLTKRTRPDGVTGPSHSLCPSTQRCRRLNPREVTEVRPEPGGGGSPGNTLESKSPLSLTQLFSLING